MLVLFWKGVARIKRLKCVTTYRGLIYFFYLDSEPEDDQGIPEADSELQVCVKQLAPWLFISQGLSKFQRFLGVLY